MPHVAASGAHPEAALVAAPTLPIVDVDPEQSLAIVAFRKSVVGAWLSGQWTARKACEHAFLAWKAGARGVSDIAVNPTAKGMNHSRRLYRAMGLETLHAHCYEILNVPLYDKKLHRRVYGTYTIRCPHEVLREAFERDPGIWDIRKHDPDDWNVPSFTGHPLTIQYGVQYVKPIGLYTDKVKLNLNEGFLRCSVGLLWARKRHTVYCILNSVLCKCGCNGQCTLTALQIPVNKSLNHLQKGIEPTHRFDRCPWRPEDATRAGRSGKRLPMGRCAVVENRGDWVELAAVSGMKGHQGVRCCMTCTTTKDEQFNHIDQCSSLLLPWTPLTHTMYLAELAACLVLVHVATSVVRDALVNNLVWKQRWPWGRTVTAGIHIAGLKAGDRLVVSDALTDLHQLEHLITPCRIYFLRTQKPSCIQGVSLLWHVPGVHEFGIDHFSCERMMDCGLHTMALGIEQKFVGKCMMTALQDDCFETGKASMPERLEEGMAKLRFKLRRFYRAQAKSHPGRSQTRIRHLTIKMLGNAANPTLKAKGAETRHCIGFAVQLMSEFGARGGSKYHALAAAGRALQTHLDIQKSSHRLLSADTGRQMMDAMVHKQVETTIKNSR